ncbi:hypothetical protein FKM82_005018 [Ascaphus truei]
MALLFPQSVLPVFRSLGALDRNVEKCNIYTNFTDCRVIFQLFCKHGVTKTHHLTYEDCEPLQAVFAKNICPNILKIQSRVLADIMIHFPTCQEEVTLTITPLKVSFKSYTEEAFGFSKAMHTEIHLSPDEFDYIQVGVDTEVTFCLKELRGFLAFADTTSAHISVHFSKPGKPVAFSLEDMVLEANFVLATLTNADSRTSSQRSQHIVLSFAHCFSEPFHPSNKRTSISRSTAWRLPVTTRKISPRNFLLRFNRSDARSLASWCV